jgi:hypothetical protein
MGFVKEFFEGEAGENKLYIVLVVLIVLLLIVLYQNVYLPYMDKEGEKSTSGSLSST